MLRRLFTGEIELDRSEGQKSGVPTNAAVRVGRAVSWLSRTTGRGSGAMIGGRMTLILQPGALRELAKNYRIALVTGTNGKTTTTRMITAALESVHGDVATNETGANMPDGHLAALMANPNATHAVLEVDEPHLHLVAGHVDPVVLVLLNLSRDQMDRVGEIRNVASSIRKAVQAHPDALVVANADDPAIVYAAEVGRRVAWVAAGANWREDSSCCPRCGKPLLIEGEQWSCSCGFARPQPGWSFSDDGITGPDGRTYPVRLQLPGAVNRANAAMAVAAAGELGCPPQQAVVAIEGVRQVAGRYRESKLAGRSARLLLAKNPAGWLESLQMVRTSDRPLVLVVNSREADGFDVSWLWDIEFELLAGRKVVVAGERATDLGVRLRYAEVDHRIVADPIAAIASVDGDPDVLANYTAFRDLMTRSDS